MPAVPEIVATGHAHIADHPGIRLKPWITGEGFDPFEADVACELKRGLVVGCAFPRGWNREKACSRFSAETHTGAMYSDAEAAALYDLTDPWDPASHGGDAHYHRLVMAAGDVLDVGCGTGGMLHLARTEGHAGRLVGLDPDTAALARARRRDDIEWVEARAAEAAWEAEFDLAVMASHAFQYLITDEELRASLAAIHVALRPGGRFAFETRHPQARAWEAWNPANGGDVVDGAGRALRGWFEVDLVEGDVVSYTGTLADPDGTILRVDRETLRFLDEESLDGFLAEAGFTVESRWGDWEGGPVTGASREIVTVARRA